MPTLLSLLWVPVCSCVFLCVVNSVFSCASCAMIPALCLSPLWYQLCTLCVCIRACLLFTPVRCVRAVSLFVCYYSCVLCVAYSRVFLCSVHPVCIILCGDSYACLSPLQCSFMRSMHCALLIRCNVCVLYFLFSCAIIHCAV